MEFKHVSVLLEETIELLNMSPNGVYVDGTLGGGGHSLKILEKLSDKGRLIVIDQDEDALNHSKIKLEKYLDKISFVHNNFSNIQAILDELDIDRIDGMIMDLGVSSYQLDEPERGFSYMHDAFLDMRMDKRKHETAHDIVNKYDEKKLTKIFYEYGEERWAKRVAEFIVNERRKGPINTTFELVSVIKKAIPKGAREDGPHPAKRIFQAIRIELNQELEILKQAISDISDRMKIGGRIAIITFHSLEDRIVKNTFRDLENPCTCPSQFPMCVCKKLPQVAVITKKPIIPSEEELEANHRARSAKLRVAEKI
ncbi:MAG: 16S rRNA (cytosine(1402)-N(4))-methyltransferase RsmH [Defluviitaleaceae bacterium]|nr:16S rRNA (cytosine(1402)-N(4))-methyltransferase RsmH [Defluviitaleaceae bacterium]